MWIDNQMTVHRTSREVVSASNPVLLSQSAQQPRLRVLISTLYRPEGNTGVQTHTRVLARSLEKNGVECGVVSAFDAGPLWLGLFAVRPLLLRWLDRDWSTRWHHWSHLIALRRALRRQIGEGLPDCVFAQCTTSARAALDVRVDFKAQFPIALVCHFNESEAAELRGQGELRREHNYRRTLRAEDAVLSEVDHVIYVSHWARETVERVRGVKPQAASVIWNSAGELMPVGPLTREEVGLAQGDLVLVNVGSLEPRKNQIGLLSLFAVLRELYPAAKLLLVGDGPARGEIERKITELKLNDSVVLLGRRTDVPAILGIADVYLHFATVDNCPLVLLEAARAGLPFAALPVGGVPELQQALDCRFELHPASHFASVDVLRPLLESVEFRKAVGGRVRLNYSLGFDIGSMTEAYVGVIRQMRKHGRKLVPLAEEA